MDCTCQPWIRGIAALTIALAVPVAAREAPRSLYDGAAVRFERAQLFKPRETTNHIRAGALAPLILQEVSTTAAPAASTGGRNNEAGLFPKQVHFQPGFIELNGRLHEQMTYWWEYDPQTPSAFAGSNLVLGLRLTMSTNHVPVIYEVLDGRGGPRQIFVTQSIEAAARAEFGAALRGRRHAVEAGLDDAPQVVVPRVLDDPPDMMGPILYLRDRTRAVATLICRCMDSQARELAGQGLYELVPADASGNTSDATRLEAAIPRWLREDFSDQTNRLSRSLRLPTGF